MEVFSQALRHSPGEGTDVIPADARADCFRMKYTTPPGRKNHTIPALVPRTRSDWFRAFLDSLPEKAYEKRPSPACAAANADREANYGRIAGKKRRNYKRRSNIYCVFTNVMV